MNTRTRLLQCAFAELERGGAEEFSLRAVSAAAGITPMAVYRHFPNREALLTAVGEEAFNAWRERAESIKATDPLEWLRQAGKLYMTFALDEPARFEACFVLKTGVERHYPEDFREGKSPVVALTVQRIEAAQAAKVLRKEDPLEVAMVFWAQLHGLAMLQRSGRMAMSRKNFLALAARAVDAVLGAFKTARSRA
jgi:AcrR family transcriptional regulator